MQPIRFVTATLATAATAALLLPLGAAPAAADRHHGPDGRHTPPHSNAKFDRLRWAAPEDFVIGTAVAGGGHHLEQDYPDPFTSDGRYRRVLAQQFSSVSPENQMKWEYLHPERDRYDFAMADRIVDFAERNGQVVRGHTLLWHSQNPAWLEEGDFTDAELREILRDHITTVVGRYSGRIHQWDVTNEIFDEAGNLRTEDNIWLRELGPGVIADAFRWAHEADPHAELFLNDYGVEEVNAKSDAYYELSQQLLADGVPLHGFSTQAHLSLNYPFPAGLEENLRRFDDLGLATAVTEMDVRMNVPENGRPTAAQLREQADYYRQGLAACLAVEGCDSFTIWGFTDKYSWVPVFFEGEGSATVMTDDYTRKPAYHALWSTLKRAEYDRG
ncbi:endo-1,4-beta-xylanase [Streptomonospora nanhaiensis]|uniref:Beta-xylanase n=1 Tax=Streptomonospora nanhaiensis TaxID=1323731 RepID=A0A853BIY4_9ACTN|nr:endo-1,4-beta-xylanase [Streptomonospora nanhaiensis]MBV2365856.1 endo-1,4-beta-xylanase [Streptomonospora nanhaiensis]MBX9387589.1 endo-1,4-beta-xylanase [Streptomonospora nanhaiensis]NYI95233.1 endo-1,4-beta-xylanase [Streptomonospora nanhaiensis]